MNNKFQHTNKSDFKIPEGYFESLESRILKKLNDPSALQVKVNTGFKVPEKYFEEFKVETQKSKVIPWKKITFITSIAASILLLLTFLIPKEPTFESLEIATIENYLLSESYAAQEVASIFDETDLTLEAFNLKMDDEVVENYLIENIDVDILIE